MTARLLKLVAPLVAGLGMMGALAAPASANCYIDDWGQQVCAPPPVYYAPPPVYYPPAPAVVVAPFLGLYGRPHYAYRGYRHYGRAHYGHYGRPYYGRAHYGHYGRGYHGHYGRAHYGRGR